MGYRGQSFYYWNRSQYWVGHFRPGRVLSRRYAHVALSQSDNRLDSTPTAIPGPDSGSRGRLRFLCGSGKPYRLQSCQNRKRATLPAASLLNRERDCSRQQRSFLAQSGNWPGWDLMSDQRIRHGLKLGLAGLLALCLTQLLPLPHDSWAILTVLVI